MYMSKRIEKFIEQNRHLMDTENVPEAVWQKIQLPVAEKKRSLVIAWKPLYKWAAAAAVTALVAMTTYLLIEKYSHDIPEQGGGVAKSDTLPPGDIKQLAPEYAPQAEDIYNSIAVNKKELENRDFGISRVLFLGTISYEKNFLPNIVESSFSKFVFERIITTTAAGRFFIFITSEYINSELSCVEIPKKLLLFFNDMKRGD